jgi:hypothetical protein
MFHLALLPAMRPIADAVRDSTGFDAKRIVHGDSKPLLANPGK